MAEGVTGSVLVIEDDADIRDTIRTMLEIDGYRVLTAENGRKALDLLRNGERPGLLLLDLMMPVMNGWQFREEQQRDAVLSSIPVVVISGDGRVAEKTATLGGAAYLRKPIDLDVLLATVGRYVGRGSPPTLSP